MVNVCKECGCKCKNEPCVRENSIEDNQLKDEPQQSSENYLDEITRLTEDLNTWQDKYKRLSDAYKRVQRVNQGLEDKLLKLVDACETDKNILTMDVAVLSEKLAEANYTIKKLTESNERYKNDVSLAIQFLQCKQSNYVVHKFDSLPPTVQTEVSVYLNGRRKSEEKKQPIEAKSIKVPMPTFPPTAMFYSLPKHVENEPETTASSQQNVDVVSAAIMAKILEERQRERLYVKHCDTCTCSKNSALPPTSREMREIHTQTDNLTRTNCKNCDNLTKIQTFEPENFTTGNIVKVQPNNFLLENNNSNDSNSLNLNSNPANRKEAKSQASLPVPQTRNFKPVFPISSTHHKLNINTANVKKTNNMIHVHRNAEIVENPRKMDSELENLLNKEAGQKFSKTDSKETVQFLDRTKYQEMEENVKRFLFKKTELWKEPTNYDQEISIQTEI